jgi:hypothetical protein
MQHQLPVEEAATTVCREVRVANMQVAVQDSEWSAAELRDEGREGRPEPIMDPRCVLHHRRAVTGEVLARELRARTEPEPDERALIGAIEPGQLGSDARVVIPVLRMELRDIVENRRDLVHSARFERDT